MIGLNRCYIRSGSSSSGCQLSTYLYCSLILLVNTCTLLLSIASRHHTLLQASGSGLAQEFCPSCSAIGDYTNKNVSQFKGTGYIIRGGNSIIIVFLPSEKGLALKGKNLLSLRNDFLPFRLHCFSDRSGAQENIQEVTKVVFLFF